MKKKTRLVALLLAVLMLISVMPLTLFAAEETDVDTASVLDASVLDMLANEQAGSPFEMMGYDELTATLAGESDLSYLRLTSKGGGLVGDNGMLITEGYFGASSKGVPNYTSPKLTDYGDSAKFFHNGIHGGNTLTSFNFTKYENGEYQIADKTDESDLTFMYAGDNPNGGSAYAWSEVKYVVFSANIKRGEALPDGTSITRMRLKNGSKTVNKDAVSLSGENIEVAGKEAGGFSTSLYTNVMLVYDTANDRLMGYANGVYLGQIKDAYSVVTDFKDVSLYLNSAATMDGRILSVRETRLFYVYDGALTDYAPEIYEEDLANGVFKIDGDYYFFKDNFPVIGATVEYGDYIITTEAQTGKIISCVKNEPAFDGAVLNAYSATLGERLGLNFYTYLPENAATVKFTFANEEQVLDISELVPEEENLYKLTAKLSSIEIGEDVTLTVLDAEGNAIAIKDSNDTYDAFTYSVKDYVNALAEDEDTAAEELEAAIAMLNYAAYAEKYFGKSDDLSTAYSEDAIAWVTSFDASEMTEAVSGGAGAEGIFAEAQLVLDDATKIRINLFGTAGAVECNVNGEYYANIEIAGSFIDICGIDAKNLDTVYTLTVDGVEAQFSVRALAALVANDEATYGADFANLMKALYLYSEACEAI